MQGAARERVRLTKGKVNEEGKFEKLKKKIDKKTKQNKKTNQRINLLPNERKFEEKKDHFFKENSI